MTPRTAVFLSIRDKATRLPGKATLDICGQPVVSRLIRRLKQVRECDLVVLTTSTSPDDVHLLASARAAGIESFAGSEDDKLARYLDAAMLFSVDFAAVVDGDDLFCSVDHIDVAIRHYRESSADYITQIGLPLGAASFGIRTASLAKVVAAKAETDTEVWGEYFTSRPDFQIALLEETDPLLRQPSVRMTLDYPEDLDFFRAVYSRYHGDGEPSLRDVMTILGDDPAITEINRSVQSQYERNLKSAAPVRFRRTYS
jgi:spore coat polysaccharide biosynthesis protein SpsF